MKVLPGVGERDASTAGPARKSGRTPAGGWLRRWSWAGLGSVLLLAVFAYLMVPPILMLLYSSLKVTDGSLPFDVAGFSLDNFRFVLRDPGTVRVLANTAAYVAGSIVVGLGLSSVLTYLLERTDLPGREALRMLVLSPMAVPAVVMAIAWVFLANPQVGPLSQAVRSVTGLTPNIYSVWGMMLVTGLLTTPSMYLLISPQFARFDSALEESAAASGANWWRRTRRIVLPLLSPAVLSAGMLIAVIALEAFDIPAILGFPKNIYVFSTLIQQELQPTTGLPNYGTASAFGVILLAVALLLAVAYRYRVRGAHRFTTITARGFRPAVVRLGRWRLPCTAFVSLYCVVGLVLPFLIIFLTSLLPYFSLSADTLRRASFDSYVKVFQSGWFAAGVVNTAVIVLVTATGTTCLAFFAGWASAHGRFRGSGLLLDGSFVSLGVPGVIVGLTVLLIYLELPIPIFGTIWIIVIGEMTRFLVYGVRLMDASFRQLDASLYEAGEVAGASRFVIHRRVVLPLMMPAVVRTWLWVAIRTLAELPIALLLSTRSNQTVAVVLFNLWTSGNDFPEAAAIAVMMVIVSAVGIWLLMRIGSPTRGELMAAPG